MALASMPLAALKTIAPAAAVSNTPSMTISLARSTKVGDSTRVVDPAPVTDLYLTPRHQRAFPSHPRGEPARKEEP